MVLKIPANFITLNQRIATSGYALLAMTYENCIEMVKGESLKSLGLRNLRANGSEFLPTH